MKISYKDFDKLSIDEKIKFFNDFNISFMVQKTFEQVEFRIKDGRWLVGFYTDEFNDWGIVNRIMPIGKNILIEYTIKNVYTEYMEESYLIPYTKIEIDDIFYE